MCLGACVYVCGCVFVRVTVRVSLCVCLGESSYMYECVCVTVCLGECTYMCECLYVWS